MDKIKEFRKVASEITDLYEKKNAAYGDSFGSTYQKLGIISAVTRIADKANRLQNLCANENVYDLGESIDDTLRDLAAYAIMTLVERTVASQNIVTNNSFMEARQGDLFLCTKDLDDKEGKVRYIGGRIYISDIDGCLTDERGIKNEPMAPDDMRYFKILDE